MLIKFSDNFESIFYAILLSNITGNFIYSKKDRLGLFENEEYIDIDKLNWQQILEEHDKRFGEIKWLDYNNPQLLDFKITIENELRKNTAQKYKRAIILIKQALKFGLVYNNTEHQEKHKKTKSCPFLVFDKKLI